MKKLDLSILIGQTVIEIEKKEYDNEVVELLFYTLEGFVYKLYHEKDCCEMVYLMDTCGDLDDIIGSPILKSESSSGESELLCGEDDYFIARWTFQKIDTIKGGVTLRWYGSSNGCYAVDVDLVEIIL